MVLFASCVFNPALASDASNAAAAAQAAADQAELHAELAKSALTVEEAQREADLATAEAGTAAREAANAAQAASLTYDAWALTVNDFNAAEDDLKEAIASGTASEADIQALQDVLDEKRALMDAAYETAAADAKSAVSASQAAFNAVNSANQAQEAVMKLEKWEEIKYTTTLTKEQFYANYDPTTVLEVGASSSAKSNGQSAVNAGTSAAASSKEAAYNQTQASTYTRAEAEEAARNSTESANAAFDYSNAATASAVNTANAATRTLSIGNAEYVLAAMQAMQLGLVSSQQAVIEAADADDHVTVAPTIEEDSRANSQINFKAPPGDLSIMFLGNVFGVVDGVLAGTGSQIAGTIFGVFNAAVLALGGIIIAYTLLLSTMNSAQDGEFLGQKFASIWVPTRSVGGAMLLLPKASGYCAMQIFIMWVVIQGVGAADTLWSQALSYLNRGGAIVKPNVDPISNMKLNGDSTVFNAAYGLFTSEVCMAAVEKEIIKYRSAYKAANNCQNTISNSSEDLFCKTEVPSFFESVNFLDETLTGPNIHVDFPNLSAAYAPYNVLSGVCGAIEFDKFSISESNAEAMGINDVEVSTLNESRNLAVNQMFEFLAVPAQQVVENSKLFDDKANGLPLGIPLTIELKKCKAMLDPYANEVKSYNPKACLMWELENGALQPILLRGTELQDAVATYTGMMSASLYIKSQTQDASNYKTQREFIRNANQSGWILAGAYYFRLAILTSQVLQNSGEQGVGNEDASSGLKVCSPLSGGSCSSWSTVKFDDTFTKATGRVCATDNKLFCISEGSEPVTNTEISAMLDKTKDLINAQDQSASTIPVVSSHTIQQPTYAQTTYKRPDTVYGFLINSTAVVMPGQPGDQQPEFVMSVDFNASSNVPQLGKSTIKGGKWNIPGQIMTIIFNNVLRPFFNLMLSMIIPMMNMMFFAFIQPPLTLLASVFLGAMEVLKNPNVNPILALSNMGVGLIEGSANSFILMVGVAVTATAISLAALGLLIMLMPVISLWLGIMVSAGTMATFYLPFVPFMLFLFASIAWLITVIEAMVAAPIIALGVMHPEGDQAFGKGEGAVMLLMGLFLRPSMMILGYIFGIILSYVGIWMVNAAFIMVVPDVTNLKMVDISGAMGGGVANDIAFGMQSIGQAFTGNESVYGMWSTIFLIFFILLVYVSTLISVVSKSFELIHILPDKIMRWVSGGQEEQTATRMSSSMTQEMKQEHKKAGDETGKAIAKMNSEAMGGVIDAIATAVEVGEAIATGGQSLADGGSKTASQLRKISKDAKNVHNNSKIASGSGKVVNEVSKEKAEAVANEGVKAATGIDMKQIQGAIGGKLEEYDINTKAAKGAVKKAMKSLKPVKGKTGASTSPEAEALLVTMSSSKPPEGDTNNDDQVSMSNTLSTGDGFSSDTMDTTVTMSSKKEGDE